MVKNGLVLICYVTQYYMFKDFFTIWLLFFSVLPDYFGIKYFILSCYLCQAAIFIIPQISLELIIALHMHLSKPNTFSQIIFQFFPSFFPRFPKFLEVVMIARHSLNPLISPTFSVCHG